MLRRQKASVQNEFLFHPFWVLIFLYCIFSTSLSSLRDFHADRVVEIVDLFLKAAGLKRHRSEAEVQRKAGTIVRFCTIAESPKSYRLIQKSKASSPIFAA
jgi:hypothetical protein